MFKLVNTVQGQALRLISHAPLTPADFAEIAKALGTTAFPAQKTTLVQACQAESDMRVLTHWNGVETANVAARGDWIVTNLDDNGDPLVDRGSNLNQYVVNSARFAELYAPTGTAGAHGMFFSPKGQVTAIELPGGFDIIAAWGERQSAPSGYLLRAGDDVYGNQRETFERTYRRLNA